MNQFFLVVHVQVGPHLVHDVEVVDHIGVQPIQFDDVDLIHLLSSVSEVSNGLHEFLSQLLMLVVSIVDCIEPTFLAHEPPHLQLQHFDIVV